jgi:hypothetical protein
MGNSSTQGGSRTKGQEFNQFEGQEEETRKGDQQKVDNLQGVTRSTDQTTAASNGDQTQIGNMTVFSNKKSLETFDVHIYHYSHDNNGEKKVKKDLEDEKK